MLRAALLGAADHRGLRRFMYRHGMNLGARRFVAGETLDELIAVAHSLNDRDITVAAGFLGESVHDSVESSQAASKYRDILTRFHDEDLRANVALKLTQLGLVLSDALAQANVTLVLERAAQLHNFVRIDMEQSDYTDATLSIYRGLRSAGHDNVGTVLQSYLYRSENDLRGLLSLAPNLRLVKGAYLEPPSIAYPKKRDVDAAYVRMLEASLQGDGFTAIATHDRAIIDHAIEFTQRHSIPRERFEFQMLYGVRPALQGELVAKGYALRLAVPFGSEWYPYLVRRLAERPANLFFFLGALWRK